MTEEEKLKIEEKIKLLKSDLFDIIKEQEIANVVKRQKLQELEILEQKLDKTNGNKA